jgi:hypothetical protein
MKLTRIAAAASLVVSAIVASSAASAGAGGSRPDGEHEPAWIDGRRVDTTFAFRQAPVSDEAARIWIVGAKDPANPSDPGHAGFAIPAHDHVLASRIPYGQRPDCRGMFVVAGRNAMPATVDTVDDRSVPHIDLVRAVDVGNGLEPLVSDDVITRGVTLGLLDEVYVDFEALSLAPITCWTESTVR